MTYPGAPEQPPHDPYSQYPTPHYTPPGYPTGQYPTYPQGTQQWPMPAPPAPKPKPKWPWIVGGVVLLLILIGISGNRQTPTTPTAAAPAAVPAAPTVTRADITTPAVAAPAPPVTAGPQASFGDGTWVVGEDIQPGTYKSTGAKQGIFELCSVSTLAGDTSDSATIDWQVANADEPIRIKATGKVKAVKASGCEDFVKVG